MNLGPYRKLIVAGLGFLILLIKHFFKLNLDEGQADAIADFIITAATLLSVHQVSNAPAAK